MREDFDNKSQDGESSSSSKKESKREALKKKLFGIKDKSPKETETADSESPVSTNNKQLEKPVKGSKGGDKAPTAKSPKLKKS